jgi:hypothetical protein
MQMLNVQGMLNLNNNALLKAATAFYFQCQCQLPLIVLPSQCYPLLLTMNVVLLHASDAALCTEGRG